MAMATSDLEEPIPRAVALKICIEILREGPYPVRAQCRRCLRASKGDLVRMCLGKVPGYRGCPLVNERFDARGSSAGGRGAFPPRA